MPEIVLDPSQSVSMNFTGAMYTLASPQFAAGALLGSFVVCGGLPPILPELHGQSVEQLSLPLPTPTDVSDFLEFNHQLRPMGTISAKAVPGSLPNQVWDY